MNFSDTIKSVQLVLATGEVPLIVGESGIGKTALAKKLAKENNWNLVVIDGNLLKEGEIGGLPTIESYEANSINGVKKVQKTTVYAVHNKLKIIDDYVSQGKEVLLFIDEINRCEHTVQQELMNLILNREINGYQLDSQVRIIAAMNPSSKYGSEFDYQVVDMDPAQENRFVWLRMEADHEQWLSWAMEAGIEEKVILFISTFPEYLHKINEDDVRATPRSYERVSKSYSMYKEMGEQIPKSVFLNVLKGNVGGVIAQELMSFLEAEVKPLVNFKEIFEVDHLHEALLQRIKEESHTRLYLTTMNILQQLTARISIDESFEFVDRYTEYLDLLPKDLMLGVMKEMKQKYSKVYEKALEKDSFVDLYFQSYASIRG